MNEKSEVFLVVIDPGHENHLALERAVVSASLRQVTPHIHLFISLDVELMSKAERSAGKGLLDTQFRKMTRVLEENNSPFSYEFYWSRDIESAILNSAQRISASMILYPYQGKTVHKHDWFTNAKWDLLRNSKCPIMLVKPMSSVLRGNILAAVNFQSPYPEYAELNKRILERGRWLSEKYGAELHVVNTYEGMSDYPDVEKIKAESGLDSGHIHVKESSKLEKTVSELSSEIDADLVLIGTRNSHDIASKFRHNTAERVASNLKVDTLVIT